MKDIKPNREPETSPSRNRPSERPDNELKNCKGAGPSSGAHKDNPHKRIVLVRHAEFNC